MMLPVTLQVPSRMVSHQMILMGLVALFGALVWGNQTGLALLVGGFAAWVPMRLFVRMVFSVFPTPRLFLTFFMAAEVIRIVLSASLFILAVRFLSVSLLPALIGYIAVIAALPLSALFLVGKAV